MREYIVPIKGDTSQLEQVLKKAQGSLSRINDNEVILRLNYDGNIKGFNQEFDKIIKACPELNIQFQYEVNKQILDQELKKLNDISLDIDLSNAEKKLSDLSSLILQANKAWENSDTDAEMDKYGDQLSKLVQQMVNYRSVLDSIGEDGKQIYQKLDKEVLSVIDDISKMEDIKPNLNLEAIEKQKARITDIQDAIENLKSLGAVDVKVDDGQRIKELEDEIKTLKADLAEIQQRSNGKSGEFLKSMQQDADTLNNALSKTIDKLDELKGVQSSSVDKTISKWHKDGIEENERFAVFNSSTMNVADDSITGAIENISGEIIRKAIADSKEEADGFIHSHPMDKAAFSDKDLVTAFKYAEQGILKQVVTSFDESMALDLSGVDLSKSNEIIDVVREKYDVIDEEIRKQFVYNNKEQVQSIGNAILDNTETSSPILNDVIKNIKNNFNSIFEKVNKSFTWDDYTDAVDSAIDEAISQTKGVASLPKDAKAKLVRMMGDVGRNMTDPVLDMMANQAQEKYQKVLFDVFSNKQYLKDGVERAVDVKAVSESIDFNFIKKSAEELANKVQDAVVEGLSDGIDAHSDSHKSEKAGENFVNGLTHSIENHTPEAIDAAKKLGDEVSAALDESLNRTEESNGIFDNSNISSPTQQFDNEIQQNLVMLENYKNTIAEIDRLKLDPETDETKRKIEELNKLADYFASKITVIRSENGHEINRSMMQFNGDWNTNLKEHYTHEQAKAFWNVAGERSGLNIHTVPTEFVGIEEELGRIEEKSNKLASSLGKDITESRSYVSRLKADLLNIIDTQNELSRTSTESKDYDLYLKDIEVFSKRSPEVLQFLDKLKTYDQAIEFVKTDEWNDFLATLPKAHDYLESIGYDFEKLSHQQFNENSISFEKEIEKYMALRDATRETSKTALTYLNTEGQGKILKVQQGIFEDIKTGAIDAEKGVLRLKDAFQEISKSYSKRIIDLNDFGSKEELSTKEKIVEKEKEILALQKNRKDLENQKSLAFKKSGGDMANYANLLGTTLQDIQTIDNKIEDIQAEVRHLRADNIQEQLESASNATEIWFRRIRDVNEILQDTGGFFAKDLRVSETYFNLDSSNDRLIAANVDTSKFLKVDAQGKRWNNLSNICDDLRQAADKLGISLDDLEDRERNVFYGNTKWIADAAEKLGYLGVRIQNVKDVGGFGDDYNLTGDIIQVFDSNLVSNIQDVTNAYKGLGDEFERIEKVTQVSFNAPKSITQADALIGSDELGKYSVEEREVWARIAELSDLETNLNQWNVSNDLSKDIESLLEKLRLGEISLEGFYSSYNEIVEKYSNALNKVTIDDKISLTQERYENAQRNFKRGMLSEEQLDSIEQELRLLQQEKEALNETPASSDAISDTDKLGNELKETGQQGEVAGEKIAEGMQEVRQEAKETLDIVSELNSFLAELENRDYGKSKNLPKAQQEEYDKARANIANYIKKHDINEPVVFASGFTSSAKDPDKYIHTIQKLNAYQKALRSDANGIATDLELGVITEEQAQKELLVLKSLDETIQRRRELLNEYKNISKESANAVEGFQMPGSREAKNPELFAEYTEAEQKFYNDTRDIASDKLAPVVEQLEQSKISLEDAYKALGILDRYMSDGSMGAGVEHVAENMEHAGQAAGELAANTEAIPDSSPTLEREAAATGEVADKQHRLNEEKKAEPEAKSWKDASIMQEFNQIIQQMDLAKEGFDELKNIHNAWSQMQFNPNDALDVNAFKDSSNAIKDAFKEIGYAYSEKKKDWLPVSKADDFKNAMRQAKQQTDEAADAQERLNQAKREEPKPKTTETAPVTEERAEIERDIQAEKESMSGLTGAIEEVKQAVDEKTERFKLERQEVEAAIEAEIMKLRELQTELGMVSNDEKNVTDVNPDSNTDESAKLQNVLSLVMAITQAVEEKTAAFGREGLVVDSTVVDENNKLTLLLDTLQKIVEVIGQIQFPSDKLTWAKDLKNIDADKLSNIGTGLQDVYNSIAGLNAKDSKFITQLNEILAKSKELENLSKILSSSQKDISKTKEAAKTDKEKEREASYNKELAVEKEILKYQHEINKAKATESDSLDSIEIKNKARIASLEKEREQIRNDRGRNTSAELRKKLNDEIKDIKERNDAEIKSLTESYKDSVKDRDAYAFAEKQVEQYAKEQEAIKKAEKEIQKAREEGKRQSKEAAEARKQQEADYQKVWDDASNAKNNEAIKGYQELIRQAKLYYELREKEASGKITQTEADALEKLKQEWADATNAAGKYQEVAGGVDAVHDKLSGVRDQFGDVQTSSNMKRAQSLQGTSDQLKALAENKKYTQELRNNLSKTAEAIDEINKHPIDLNSDDALKQIVDLEAEAKKFVSQSKLSDFKLAEEVSISKLNLQIEEFMRKNSRMGAKFKQEFQNLKIDFNKEQTIAGVKEVVAQFNNLKARVEEANKTGKSFFDTIKERAFSTSAQFIGQYLSIQDMIRYARTAFETIRELDTSLVDLRKTTTMTLSELNEFYRGSNDVAKQMGVTTKEIIDQASSWSRLGYSSKEAASEMAKVSSQFASISPGMSTDEAQTGLVSVMKAWDVDVKNVQRDILDNINILGNNFALTNKDIIEGMERAGATLSAIGMDTKDSFALFTGAQEVIQNAETVGTALKTLSLRIRGEQSLPPYAVMYMLCA